MMTTVPARLKSTRKAARQTHISHVDCVSPQGSMTGAPKVSSAPGWPKSPEVGASPTF